VDEPERALALLRSLGLEPELEGGRLLVRSEAVPAAAIARRLVEGGLALSSLHRRETTLEEYFLRLVGGGDA